MLMGELLYALVWRFGSDFVQLRTGNQESPAAPARGSVLMDTVTVALRMCLQSRGCCVRVTEGRCAGGDGQYRSVDRRRWLWLYVTERSVW
jgi:hypothetical protein